MQASHYEAAKPLASKNLWLGIPVVILSGFVGTSVFATLEKQVGTDVKIFIGSISVLAALLAALQTFLRLGDKAELHRSTAAEAGSLRREIEQYYASGNIEAIPESTIQNLREKVDALSEKAPNVSNRIWNKVKAELEKKN